jgi:DNA modification methylase
MPELPQVDLVLTDPPYKIGAKGCGLAGNREYLKQITAKNLDLGFDFSVLKKYKNWFCFCGKQQLEDLISIANKPWKER